MACQATMNQGIAYGTNGILGMLMARKATTAFNSAAKHLDIWFGWIAISRTSILAAEARCTLRNNIQLESNQATATSQPDS